MTKNFFQSYLQQFDNSAERETVENTSNALLNNIQLKVMQQKTVNGLLFGNVQSGKTRQMLGAISLLADNQYPIFILLTTDNVDLQEQTLSRVRNSLPDFCVIGEWDEVEFYNCKLSKPLILVLKKNTNVLRRWRGCFNTAGYCTAKPLVVFDDEADAASLNTKVNSNSVSTINKHLESIKAMASKCVYVEVTATPQAILLQTLRSDWKPEFVVYFPPGEKYLGGDFFFSYPKPFCIRYTDENELDDVRDATTFIPEGLRKSLMSFLVVCSHFYEKGQRTCNFLIHPGVRKDDHNVFVRRIGEHLNLILSNFDDTAVTEELKNAWEDLRQTQPDILNFDDCLCNLNTILEEQLITPVIINSVSPYDVKIDKGFNIVVGGNCLGRGLTLPNLQTVYYCRRAKTPQADTSWQHSRMFGYDRVGGLMRVFVPETLYKLFCSLNMANNVLVKQIIDRGLDGIQLIFSGKVKPTRSNVIDKKEVVMIAGGVNFFPVEPMQSNTDDIDSRTSIYPDNELSHDVDIETLADILEQIPSPDSFDWDKEKFVNCVKALKAQRPNVPCKLIIRKNRDIAKGTGTLLSPNDRILGDKFNDAIVLTLYRIVGSKEKGWGGFPFWIPNIKFPNDTCYYDTRKGV